jgi:hypothetical protein
LAKAEAELKKNKPKKLIPVYELKSDHMGKVGMMARVYASEDGVNMILQALKFIWINPPTYGNADLVLESKQLLVKDVITPDFKLEMSEFVKQADRCHNLADIISFCDKLIEKGGQLAKTNSGIALHSVSYPEAASVVK